MKKLVLSLMLASGTLVGANAAVADHSIIPVKHVEAKKVNTFCMAIVKGDIDTVKKMIALGQDVNEKSNGKTPAMYAARYNKVEILKVLVKNGANLSKKCDQGHTAKDYAKLSNAQDVLKYLEVAS